MPEKAVAYGIEYGGNIVVKRGYPMRVVPIQAPGQIDKLSCSYLIFYFHRLHITIFLRLTQGLPPEIAGV